MVEERVGMRLDFWERIFYYWFIRAMIVSLRGSSSGGLLWENNGRYRGALSVFTVFTSMFILDYIFIMRDSDKFRLVVRV